MFSELYFSVLFSNLKCKKARFMTVLVLMRLLLKIRTYVQLSLSG
jgi:hypothetical protein